MIRTSYNDIIVKIFFEGKEIQKVYKQGIQVFPDQAFDKFFWLKVFDEDDQKTYYYNCTQTSVVYQEGSTDVIKEIYYFTGQKQENHPGEDQQIYELLNDQVKITGQDYSENDFESFVDKSPNEVIAMTQKYQEQLKDLVNIKLGMQKQDKLFSQYGAITYQTLSKQNIINNGLGFEKLSEVSDDYLFNYSDYTSDKDSKLYQLIFKNISGEIQYFYYITTGQYEYYTYGHTFVTADINNFKDYTGPYSELPDNEGNGWTTNKGKTRGVLYHTLIPADSYISFYITLRSKNAGETFYNTFCYKEKSFSVINGNFLNHKYISDITQEKQIGKIKYNFAYAIVKNDLNKKVYQTNCKYIISQEELPAITANKVLQIPKQSLGWKLLTNEEFKTYSPNNSKYKMILTVSNMEYTGEEFWGLLDKSSDSNDFRIFGYLSTTIFFDPGSDRTDFERYKTNTTPITFIIDGKNNTFEAWENEKKINSWWYLGNYCKGFTDNNSDLYLNAYNSESNLTNEKFWFYEFKIVDSDSGKIIKRIVPSNDRTKLWECVSEKFIEPCRTVSDEANLPVLLDNLKLGVETKDGLGNKIEDWLIY